MVESGIQVNISLRGMQYGTLTQRELEVLALVAQGNSNKMIGECLVIAVHTVKNHMVSIMWKLCANDRTQAVITALLLGWLRLENAERSGKREPTQRELEVLALVAQGNSNKMIGECLVIAEHTVRNHVFSIMQKLCTNDRTKAVITAMRLGWLLPENAEPSGKRVLTQRELEVLALVAQGNSNKMIGECLKITTHAAKNSMAVIMWKLCADDRTQAVITAIRFGWLRI